MEQTVEEQRRAIVQLELCLKLKDMRYNQLKSGDEPLEFDHKELFTHAVRLKEQICQAANHITTCVRVTQMKAMTSHSDVIKKDREA